MSRPRPPNILLIMSDQHNARCMSCAGEPLLRTPSMDRLAREGVRFTHAFTVSAHCGPSRVSFLTGMYEHTHRRHRNVDEPPDHLNPITSTLKRAGYETAIIGKGHLGVRWPRRQFNFCRFSTMTDAHENDPLSCDYFRSLVEAGVADQYDMTWQQKAHPECAHRSPLPLEHSPEVWCGNETVQYLRQRDPGQPFFALVSFERPHDPLSVPAPYDTMYDRKSVALPANATDTFEGKSARQQNAANGYGGYPFRPRDEAHLKTCIAHYYGLVSLIDEQIGRIVEELGRQGILDDTVIIYTADHGDFAGEHGFMWKNLGFYECIHRIPLIIRYPSVFPEKRTFDEFVESVDIYPTLAELVDTRLPWTVQGRSFRGAVCDGADWGKRAALCEHVKSYHHMSMRTSEFRVTVDATGDESELYDHRSDPGELHNQWQNPDYGETRERLLADMLRFRACPTLLYGPPPSPWYAASEPPYDMPKWSAAIRDVEAGKPWSQIRQDGGASEGNGRTDAAKMDEEA